MQDGHAGDDERWEPQPFGVEQRVDLVTPLDLLPRVITLTPHRLARFDRVPHVSTLQKIGSGGAGYDSGGRQVWNGVLAWTGETSAEINPEGDAEPCAGMHRCKEGIAAVASIVTGGATADLARRNARSTAKASDSPCTTSTVSSMSADRLGAIGSQPGWGS